MADRIAAEVFPPGEFIKEELEAREWTQTDLAEILGRPIRLVNELIAGKKQITPETAKGLGEAFGTGAMFWMNLESAYRLSRVNPVNTSVARKATLYAKFPLRELIKRRWIEPSDNLEVLAFRVCQFFAIEEETDTPRFAHAAKASDYSERSSLQWAWLYRAKSLSHCVQAAAYSEQALREAMQRLANLLHAPEEIRHVPRILSDAGVRFVIVESLAGAKIDGATFWIDPHKPVIAMSLRFDRINNFWFVLRHECEHVLNRDAQDSVVLDVEIVDGTGLIADLPKEEKRANDAAEQFVVPMDQLNDFIARVRPLYSEQRILAFAKRINVHPGLVVGQLQRRGEIPYSHFHKYLVKIRHIITQSALTDGWGSIPVVSTQ
jgi:HTH-type transcriptional regulator/antitoxin HigA